jgi:hypothetical protein
MIKVETYASAQTDTTIITPSAGKSILIWDVIVESDSSVSLKFNTSNITAVRMPNAGRMEDMLVDEQGAVDEVLSITCGTGNTTVKIHYYEL